MKTEKPVRYLVTAALIAALYTALTLTLAPISFAAVQCRVAEALTVLAVVTPAAIPGLTVGCVVSNLVGISLGASIIGLPDVVVGSLATLLAAVLSYRWRNRRVGGLPVLATMPPVVFNALAVGSELTLVAPVRSVSVWLIQMGLVAAGQAVACIGGGLLLFKALQVSGLEKRLGGELS